MFQKRKEIVGPFSVKFYYFIMFVYVHSNILQGAPEDILALFYSVIQIPVIESCCERNVISW